MANRSRRITGYEYETRDRVKKEASTKNVVTQTILRKIVKVYVLECGHKRDATDCKVRKNDMTTCYVCNEV